MPTVSPLGPTIQVELSDHPPSSHGPGATANAVPRHAEIAVVVPGKHGGNVGFIFRVALSANGEEFMNLLREFLHSSVFPSPHVSYRGRITRLLFRDTIGLGTVSGLTAPLLDDGQVWPVHLLLSESTHSPNFTAGYRWPPYLRHSPRFAENPTFRNESNDWHVLVIGRRVNRAVFVGGVVAYIILGLLFYSVIGLVGRRWDIAAGVGVALFAILNILQGLVFWLLK